MKKNTLRLIVLMTVFSILLISPSQVNADRGTRHADSGTVYAS